MTAYTTGIMRTSDYDYPLPDELIAQEPAAERDGCRMLVMDRATGALRDCIFRDIEEYLQPGDLLVANETRVLPARLLGAKRGTGGAAEVFLLREVPASTAARYAQGEASNSPQCSAASTSHSQENAASSPNQVACWKVLVRPGKRLKPGTGAVVDFTDETGTVVLSAEIVDWAEGAQKGERVARLSTPLASFDEALHAVGNTPLPPYIKNYTGDTELYQTVFSKRESSAAAPTAGLHFTPELIDRLRAKGVRWETVELEVGLDTFRVVDEEDPAEHQIHTEFFTVPQRVVEAVAETRAQGGRVVAVGTTSVRSLESAWDDTLANNGTAKLTSAAAANGQGGLRAREREATSLYILPGYEFHAVDALITNFHVPRSTLMMLVSAFSSRENLLAAYDHAIEERYRLLSFGDAMFIATTD